MSAPREHLYTTKMLCPYCNGEQTDVWDFIDDNEDGTIECGWCDKEFNWSVNHSISYTTTRRTP